MPLESIRPRASDIYDEASFDAFLSAQPTARVVRAQPPDFGSSLQARPSSLPTQTLEDDDTGPSRAASKGKSRFALQREAARLEVKSVKQAPPPDDAPIGRFHFDLPPDDGTSTTWQKGATATFASRMLGEIVERDVGPSSSDPLPSRREPASHSAGFPISTRLAPSASRNTMLPESMQGAPSFASSLRQLQNGDSAQGFERQPLFSPPERQAISRENDSVLSQMSSADILREQAELREDLASRNPKLLAWLVKRQSAAPSQAGPRAPNVSEAGAKHLRFAESPPTYISPASLSSMSSASSAADPPILLEWQPLSPTETGATPSVIAPVSPAAQTSALCIGRASQNSTPTRPRSPFLPLLEAGPVPPSQRPAETVEDDFLPPSPPPEATPVPPSIDHAESLRREYFPQEPPDHESLRWMRDDTTSDALLGHMAENATLVCRYGLTGSLVGRTAAQAHGAGPSSHHHAASTSAFELGELFGLTRSAVAQQRAMGLRVMARIVVKYSPSAVQTLQGTDLGQAMKEVGEAAADMATVAGESLDDRNVGVISAALELLRVLYVDVPSRGSPDPLVKHLFGSRDVLAPLSRHFRDVTLDRPLLQCATDFLTALVGRGGKAAAEEVLRVSGLLEAIVNTLAGVQWPPPSQTPILPSIAPLELLHAIAEASRQCCALIVERGLTAPLLRYLALPYWRIDAIEHVVASRTALARLTGSALDMLATFAAYGLGAHIRSDLDAILRQLSEHLQTFAALQSDADAFVAARYLHLLRRWMECAIDPHVTTPSHSITWTQVAGWTDEALDYLKPALAAGRNDIVTEACEMLVIWIKQSGRKRFDAASVLRRLVEVLGPLNAILLTFATRLAKSGEADSASLCRTVTSVARLFRCQPELSKACRLDSWLVFSASRAAIRQAVKDEAFSHVAVSLAELSNDFDLMLHASLVLRTSDGALIVKFLDLINESIRQSHLIGHGNGANFILPLLKAYVRQACTGVTLSHLDPDLIESSTAQSHETAFVFMSSWPMIPVLLADAPTLDAIAEQRDLASPREALRHIVISSLELLFRLHQAIVETEALPGTSFSKVWQDVAPVFLLDQGRACDRRSDASTPIFRDPTVSALLDRLLEPYTLKGGHPLGAPEERAPLMTAEVDAADFATFTDLLGLYDAESFSDINFSRILLPRLSMRQPIDFRALLFRDYGHVLRHFQVTVAAVPLDDKAQGLFDYLYPLETDELMLGMYCRALTMREIDVEANGFLFLYATHHLSAGIWSSDGDLKESTRVAFAKAVLAAADPVCEAVIGYDPDAIARAPMDLPQACLEGETSEAKRRFQWIQGWAEPTLRDRARRTFEGKGLL